SEDEVVEIESTGGVRTKNHSYQTHLEVYQTKTKREDKTDHSQDQEFSKILEETGIVYNVVTYQISAENAAWKSCMSDSTAAGGSSHPSTQSPSNNEEENEIDGESGNLEKEGEQWPKTKKAKANVNAKKHREKVNYCYDRCTSSYERKL
ncbi:Interstitial collagenase, partial [Bienertia sinuspersici]